MKQSPSRIMILFVYLLLLGSFAGDVFSQEIPEEAQRRMVRGVTAVKTAKSPQDLEAAVKEFQEAARLAPDWPDAWYNLGLTQEKVGKFKEAVASLKKYLALAPNDPAASEIRTMIYELEYKAEQVLTISDIVDILTSCGGEGWEKFSGEDPNDLKPAGGNPGLFLTRASDHSVRATTRIVLRDKTEAYSELEVTGPFLNYSQILILHIANSNQFDTGRDQIEIEVVSRNLVKKHLFSQVPWMSFHEYTEFRKK